MSQTPNADVILADDTRRERLIAAMTFGWEASRKIRPALEVNLSFQMPEATGCTAEYLCTYAALMSQDICLAEVSGGTSMEPEPEVLADIIERNLEMIRICLKSYLPSAFETLAAHHADEAAEAAAHGEVH